MIFPQSKKPCSTTIQNNRKNCYIYIYISFFDVLEHIWDDNNTKEYQTEKYNSYTAELKIMVINYEEQEENFTFFTQTHINVTCTIILYERVTHIFYATTFRQKLTFGGKKVHKLSK